jgi:cell division septation protein DedD
MSGVFDEEGVEEAAPRRDTELTLGSITLLLIFFGLVLLCGLCFGMGYSLGHRESQGSLAGPTQAGDTRTTALPDGGHPKPSANAQAGSMPPTSTATNQQAPPGADTTGSSLQSSTVAATGGLPNGTGKSQQPAESGPSTTVKPALGATAIPAQAIQPPASAVAPALAASGPLMVQIAAVSHTEDADVLMSALRRRGYAVVSRREPLDGLIHVRIGPFKTRDEADTWRQKLLNDGYNAIVQP